MLSKSVGALVFGLVLLLSSGAQADEKDAKKLANPVEGKCPVSKKDIDAKVTVEVDKKTYGFCCEKCAAKFKEHPEKFLKKDEKK
jgi:YHS domain-containing protein